MRSDQPVLEIGGSHVTGALVDPAQHEPVLTTVRLPLDSAAGADAIMATLLDVAGQLPVAPGARWAVAFPGPFDYAAGVGQFTGVGKFDALRGFSVRTALAEGLHVVPGQLCFVNDADAFGLGVWAAGQRTSPLIGITLGTGVGSSFIRDGVAVRVGDSVPPDAEMHLTSWAGAPLEETVSHRAIVAAFAEATGEAVPGVREVVERARSGQATAGAVLTSAFTALGSAVAPWLDRFGADQLAFGGSMVAAWDLLQPPIMAGLAATLRSPMPRLSVIEDTERAALVGAAFAGSHR